ncbi:MULTISPECIES: PAS domain-containing protein [unclassified Devosia]|uniref:PAS domain-containing protein n=1 Tax=unclassified Devosia TaxID=196773 RepID=UPI000712B7D6|nr:MULTISPECIES: PAS domain-containing protein [unclassified Devosia]KQN74887.1 histidine kinase [Devosia sp. Leaf64]KQT42794.1 histidine kinase [Devosia sp. Leaf420]
MADQQITPELANYISSARVALALADVNDDHRLVMVNTAFCDLTGYGSDEVVGQNCRFLQVSRSRGKSENVDALTDIHRFLSEPDVQTVRTPIVNFTKDDKPFVNLLFMSKLKGPSGTTRYIFASQFDVSRSHLSMLDSYDLQLSQAISGLSPVLQESGMIIEGSLATIANSAAMIAQAKMILSQLEASNS